MSPSPTKGQGNVNTKDSLHWERKIGNTHCDFRIKRIAIATKNYVTGNVMVRIQLPDKIVIRPAMLPQVEWNGPIQDLVDRFEDAALGWIHENFYRWVAFDEGGDDPDFLDRIRQMP